jgi:hypothetical protein
MKHLLYISILLFSINSFGQSIALPDSNAVWSVYNEKYFIDGDSTFNSVDYKKYYLTTDSLMTNPSFFAIAREDTLTREVYAIASGDTLEHLLYDFSLNVNDTTTVYPLSFLPYSGPIKVQVEAVDSVLIGTVYHKRQKVVGFDQDTGMDEYWIEGIGSTMGLFNSGVTGYVIFDIYYPVLLCFEKDDILLYDSPFYSNCYEDYPTGINDIEFQKTIDIFPNPVTNSVSIKSETEISGYQIVSASGQIISTQRVKTSSISVDMTNFDDGVYIFQLTTENGVVSKKIIKNGLQHLLSK